MISNMCIVCGKEFEAKQRNYTLCSAECRQIQKKANRERYKHTDKYREKIKERCKKHYVTKNCEFCGERLPNGKQKYCLDCLLSRFKAGDTNATHTLNSRGYSVKEIWQEIKSRE